MPQDYTAEVLEIAAAIPEGAVLSYGDVAELAGRGGPRQVGAIMGQWGSSVPWWRVLRTDGTLPSELWQRALPNYLAEGTPLNADQTRVRMASARWQGPDGGAAPELSPVRD